MATKHGNGKKLKQKGIKIRTRRGGIKHKRRLKVNFSLLGNNAAGIKAKKESLEANINIFKKPSCITLQETKLPQNSNFQVGNYQVFQKNRNGAGGGLLTAVDPDLDPVQIATRNEEAEILTVQIYLNNQKLRIINAYGPQDDDIQQSKLNFWLGIEEEIISAKEESCMIIIQMDANAKVGRGIITHNPSNVIDSNGQKLLEIMDRHGLLMLNSHTKCVGTVTRFRATKNNTETAILDYVLVCEELGKHLDDIFIDEKRQFTLTKYATTKGIRKKVESDHNLMFCKFTLTYERKHKHQERKQIFNLKNKKCQDLFYAATNNGSKLQDCIDENESLEVNSNKFFKTFDDVLHQCFTKIRIKAFNHRSEASFLIEKKSKLVQSLSGLKCKLAQEIVAAEITRIEDDISKLSATRNAHMVQEYVSNLESDAGNFSQVGLWKLKRKLCKSPIEAPTAKLNSSGNLITSPNLIKKLYLDTYTERLKNREMKSSLQDLFLLKTELWELRLEELRASKSKLWTQEDLENVLKKLKNNKTRDPHGLINEIFKPGIIGHDLKMALLKLFNSIKNEQRLPKCLQYANITTIWKKKGSKQDLNNDRGIFVVSVIRMILDSLIYQDKYSDLDINMSCSNIGARKQRNVRDHLFVVNGIINSVLNGESSPVDIQIYDIEKCFDALWLDDCMLDLYETLPMKTRDDKISLIYEMNKQNYVAVKTALGLTDRILLPKLVMQGGKWGPLKCSNTMDKIGKNCFKTGKHLYTYKQKVKVMPLAMIDDLIAINPCGPESLSLNLMINSKIEAKKLRCHVPDSTGKSKCHIIHVGKSTTQCKDLKVHGFPVEKVKYDTYLGDIITQDGTNKLNTEARVNKGLGLVSQILDILKSVSFGSHFFEIAKTLRNSILIGGMLTNCEVWNTITQNEISQLEEVDKLLLRKILNVATSCPIEALYLELGCVPLRYIIQSRRVNYLHHLVTRSESEMLSQFFYTQWNYPAKKNEWTEKVREDLEDLGIEENLENMKKMSKHTFKNLVKKRVLDKTLVDLLGKKEQHKKMKNLEYTQLEMQEYFKNKDISPTQARIIFKFRTRMEKFSENFKGGKPTQQCPVCTSSTDTQSHSFSCPVIVESLKISGSLEDIFEQTISNETAITLENIIKFREGYT